jgi:prolyl-tRNA editing enzyme YbaK/EbsC (Cys-tRNA(Pro) deacylase)
MEKTTAIRMLEQQGIDFRVLEYPVDDNGLSVPHAAKLLGMEPVRVFKTSVLHG